MDPKSPKPRSQKRQRQERINVILTQAEKEEIEAKAARAGLSMSGYLRALAFGKDVQQPRGARRPVVEKELLVKLLGELGKIGSNVNQIAHVANQGRNIDFPALDRLSFDLAEIRHQVKLALGREEDSSAVQEPIQEEKQPPPVMPAPPSTIEHARGSFFGNLFKGRGK